MWHLTSVVVASVPGCVLQVYRRGARLALGLPLRVSSIVRGRHIVSNSKHFRPFLRNNILNIFVMRFSAFGFLVVAGASLCKALPTNLTNFLLVTSSQLDWSANTSDLKAVSATSLFVNLSLIFSAFFILKITGPIQPTSPSPPPNRPWLQLTPKLHFNLRDSLNHRHGAVWRRQQIIQ